MPEPSPLSAGARAPDEDHGSEAFRRRLLARVLEACYRSRPREGEKRLDPRDAYDFSPGPSWSERPRERLEGIAVDAISRTGFARRQFGLTKASRSLSQTLSMVDGLARTYELLGDAHSRELLLELLVLRALGPKHAELPVTATTYWSECGRIDQTMRAAVAEPESDHRALLGIPLHRYWVPAQNGRIELSGWPKMLVEVFVLEQYAYRRAGVSVRAEPGDVVIDGGAWAGDTALYFADAVGAGGHVHGFEFVDANLSLLERNLALNARLADRIDIARSALWDASGEALPYESSGGVTQVGGEARAGSRQVETETLDDFVERARLERVDLVKLDIEGAELRALRGAEQVLRRFRPKLAIAAYHEPEDLATIPAYLDDLDLGYELFVDHFSPTDLETVLFAKARRPDR